MTKHSFFTGGTCVQAECIVQGLHKQVLEKKQD